jgi:hypothetical protein
MAAIIGVILQLPLLKQLLAIQQLQSRYIEALIASVDGGHVWR